MKIDKKAVRFTLHSLLRANQYRVSISELIRAWFNSNLYELKVKEREYKFKVYGLASLDTFYTFDKKTNLAFTCTKTGELITIITVTDRKIANGEWREG